MLVHKGCSLGRGRASGSEKGRGGGCSMKDNIVKQVSRHRVGCQSTQGVAKGNSFHLSESQLSHLCNGAANNSHHIQAL